MKKAAAAAILLFAIPGCGQSANDTAAPPAEGKVSGAAVGEALENAAEQSEPAAREVLEDAADVAKDQQSLDPVGEPGSFAQDAMKAAGDAQSRSQKEPSAE